MEHVVFMNDTTFMKILEHMHRFKLKYFQCDEKLYKLNKVTNELKCMINNIDYTIMRDTVFQCEYDIDRIVTKYKSTKFSPVKPKRPLSGLLSEMP